MNSDSISSGNGTNDSTILVCEEHIAAVDDASSEATSQLQELNSDDDDDAGTAYRLRAINTRVAKMFDLGLYFGTITSTRWVDADTKQSMLYHVDYDDDSDEEDYYQKEYNNARGLYKENEEADPKNRTVVPTPPTRSIPEENSTGELKSDNVAMHGNSTTTTNTSATNTTEHIAAADNDEDADADADAITSTADDTKFYYSCERQPGNEWEWVKKNVHYTKNGANQWYSTVPMARDGNCVFRSLAYLLQDKGIDLDRKRKCERQKMAFNRMKAADLRKEHTKRGLPLPVDGARYDILYQLKTRLDEDALEGDDATYLRQEIVQHMLDNLEDFRESIPLCNHQGVEDFVSAEAYLNNMKKSGVYGDHIELSVFAELYDFNVRVLNQDGEDHCHDIPCASNNGAMITVLYTGVIDQHYEAAIELSDSEAPNSSVLQTLKYTNGPSPPNTVAEFIKYSNKEIHQRDDLIELEKAKNKKQRVEDPAAEAPVVIEDPAIEDPAIEDLAVEAPVVEAPVVEDQAVEDQADEDQAVEAPVVAEDLVVIEDPLVEVNDRTNAFELNNPDFLPYDDEGGDLMRI